MEMFLFVLILVALLAWYTLRIRLGRLEQQVWNPNPDAPSPEQLAALAGRIWRLEQKVAGMERSAVVAEPVPPVPAPKEVIVAVVEPPRPAPPKIEPRVERPAPPPPPKPVEPPAPVVPTSSWSERLREWLGGEQWEAIIGASLLNKLGAVVTVIAIALFLAYSFTQVSPAGRALISVAVSTSMLVAGVLFERRERYRFFARGLIGAGWAALYATSYAIWALPAARLIENPFIGSLVMTTVAAGMIAHSLRYRAQALTAVAYFAAFAALVVTPSTPFAVLSLIPLAISILYLAYRFEWHAMPLFGLVAIYLTCISRGDSNSPLASTEALFLAYWTLFEGFDLLRTRRRLSGSGMEWVFPLNTAAFLALSYLKWSSVVPADLWKMAAIASALFLASAIARALVRPPSSFTNNETLPQRIAAGSYEGALTVSAVLAGLAIVGRVPGIWMSVGLALEAELLYLAGVKLRLRFLRHMGTTAFCSSLARLTFNAQSMHETQVLGVTITNWTPAALFHAFLFYVNCVLDAKAVAFSYVASLLAAVVLGIELPLHFVGTAWIALGAVLFEIGLRSRREEFRNQGYLLGLSGAVMALSFHAAPSHPWISLAVGFVFLYANALRCPRLALDDRERAGVAWGSSVVSIALAAALLWQVVPFNWIGLAWCGLALACFELGSLGWPSQWRPLSFALGLAGAVAVVATHALDFARFPFVEVSASYFGAAACAAYLAARTLRRDPVVRDSAAIVCVAFLMPALWMTLGGPLLVIAWTAAALIVTEIGFALDIDSFRWLGNAAMALPAAHLFGVDMQSSVGRLASALPVIAAMYYLSRRMKDAIARLHSWIAAIAVVLLIGAEAPAPVTDMAWATYGLLLLVIGVFARERQMRFQSYAIAALTFGAGMLHIFGGSEQHLANAIAVIASYYFAEAITSGDRTEPEVSAAFSLLGTTLLTALLFNEVSGKVLTVAWGLEGLALLAAGFPLRIRMLRWQGLALLLACILKLFLYDLRNLETLYRILSFVALGLIAMGVSWVYTRFRRFL